MKKILILSIILGLTALTNAQEKGTAPPAKPRILGVVMGISKYQNVPSLKYADKDALSFYNFLLSPAGGGADTNNIRLLLNEKATSYNFFEAMDNLLDMAKEGDQVYIYFAGHGDIEKKTERQNGFLIGYNAPANCYAAGGCISVRFLQDYVETLVSKNKSKVTLIIDACRSGKLAGGSQGAEITALALQAEWKGVTKILSCQPGETSLESEKWGGGSGVFTYFMLKGLLGQADRDGDGIVSVMELNNFLDENVLRETNKKQLPEIVGDRRQDIVKVDRKSALAMLNQMEKPITLPQEKQSAGFEADISSVNDISILKEYVKFKEYIDSYNLIAYNAIDSTKETALLVYRLLENNKSALPILSKMKGELLAALQNKAQIIMNGWIKGNIPDKTFIYAYHELQAANSLIDSSSSQFGQVKYKYLFWSSIIEGDTIKKIKLLEECIQINPDEPFAYLNLGGIYNELKIYDKAFLNFDKAIELSKNWSWVWGNKGKAFNDIGKYEDAIKCYDEAIKIKPDYFDAWNNKGNNLFNIGKFNEALKCYDEAIKIKPDLADAWDNKGINLFSMGKYDESFECFDEAIKIQPKFYKVWYIRGYFTHKLGKYEEAIKFFDRTIEIKPDFADAWDNKGYALFNLQKFREANQCFDKLIELKENNELAWLNKGLAFENMKEYESAINCYNMAIKIKPNYYEAWYNKGWMVGKLGKFEESIKSYDKALELNPDSYEAYDLKGYYLFKSGRHDEGLSFINKALEININYANAWYNKACCFALMKNKGEMLKYLKKAIELDRSNKLDAPKDEDFEEYWNDPEFLELVK